MVKPNTLILGTLCTFAWTFQTALAGVATLYFVDAPIPSTARTASLVTEQGTTRVSAVGTGENGRTRYEYEAVQSLIVADVGGTTRTLISEPYTQKYQFEENETELKLYEVLTDDGPHITAVEQDCKLDISKQSGECVHKHVTRIDGLTDSAGITTLTRVYTGTTTFSGALFPVATITTSGAGSVLLGSSLGVKGALLAVGASVMAFSRFL